MVLLAANQHKRWPTTAAATTPRASMMYVTEKGSSVSRDATEMFEGMATPQACGIWWQFM